MCRTGVVRVKVSVRGNELEPEVRSTFPETLGIFPTFLHFLCSVNKALENFKYVDLPLIKQVMITMGKANTLPVVLLPTLPTVLLSQILFAKHMWMIVMQTKIEKALGQTQIADLLLTFQPRIALNNYDSNTSINGQQ